MKPKKVFQLNRTVLIVLAIHVLLSLVLVLLPALPENTVTRIYKKYSLIGPFFSEGVIENSNLIYVSWKVGDQWSLPSNPPLLNYTNFFKEFNPSLYYRSSLERYIYKRALVKRDSGGSQSAALVKLKLFQDYVKEKYVTGEADSFKVLWIRSTAKDFDSSTDTLTTLLF